jgi:hypothetical protein
MLRVEREHRFDCSVETGFAYITNLANWSEYWPGFVGIEPDSRWSVPGDEAVVVVRLLGREVGLHMTLRPPGHELARRIREPSTRIARRSARTSFPA